MSYRRTHYRSAKKRVNPWVQLPWQIELPLLLVPLVGGGWVFWRICRSLKGRASALEEVLGMDVDFLAPLEAFWPSLVFLGVLSVGLPWYIAARRWFVRRFDLS